MNFGVNPRLFLGIAAMASVCLAGPGTKIPTTSTTSFSTNPVNQGDSVTAVASISPSVSDTGDLRLEQYFVAGLPASCSVPGGTFSLVADANVAPISSANTSVSTAAAGSFGFRTHFVPQGGSDFHESMSSCVDLVVQPVSQCSGFLIAAIQSSGTNMPVAGQKWTGSFVIRVSNCTNSVVPGVSAQGGTSAWTTTLSYSADDGSVGVRKNVGGGNKILLWLVGDMDPQEVGNLTVNLEGTIKANTPSGTVVNINGGWSASSNGSFLAGYTSPLLLTVQ